MNFDRIVAAGKAVAGRRRGTSLSSRTMLSPSSGTSRACAAIVAFVAGCRGITSQSSRWRKSLDVLWGSGCSSLSGRLSLSRRHAQCIVEHHAANRFSLGHCRGRHRGVRRCHRQVRRELRRRPVPQTSLSLLRTCHGLPW